MPSGGPGTVINLGDIVKFELTPEIKGDRWYEIALEMMQDPHVKQGVDAVVSPLQGATWAFNASAKTPLGSETAKYAAWDFFECNDWDRVVQLCGTGMVRDGFRLLEFTDSSDRIVPTDRFPLHPGRGRGVGYTGIHDRPATTIQRWLQSEKEPWRADGIVQWIDGSDAEEPGERIISLNRGDLLLRMAWAQEGANFEGNPALRAAYGAWKAKRILLTLYMLWHQRESLGIPQLTEPLEGNEPTQEEVAKAKEILRTITAHRNAYIYVPRGWSFKWAISGGQPTGLREAIEMFNRDIAFNIGVAFMLLGNGSSKHASYALATTQQGHYALLLERYARRLAAAFNRGDDGWSPIHRLITRNYGDNAPIPTLVARNMVTRDWSKILPLMPALVKAGLLRSDAVLRDFIREVMFVPPEDEETVDELTKEARDLLQTEPVESNEREEPADEEARRLLADQEATVLQLSKRVEVIERAHQYLERRAA